jgi:pyridinium-3,5-biscarboxylic acid mononucleotide sulfurtransferase
LGVEAPDSQDPSPPLEKLAELRAWFRHAQSVLVCFSGGIDSAFVLHVAAAELGPRAIALTALSPSLAESDRADAERFAQSIGAVHRTAETDELSRPEYARNEPDRCFHCKTVLFDLAEKKRREWGLALTVTGANADDVGDFRPGHDAAKQAGVRAPLLELGITKTDVRALARQLGLAIWDKPAAACLASRIPYGTSVTAERLGQIGGFEADLRELGFRQVRVRWHDRVARLELGENELEHAAERDLRGRIVELGKRHGFHYVALDLQGYRQGSHNEVLVGRSLRIAD